MTSFFEWFKSGAKIKRWLLFILIGVMFVSYSMSKVLIVNVINLLDIIIMIISGVLGILIIVYGLDRKSVV